MNENTPRRAVRRARDCPVTVCDPPRPQAAAKPKHPQPGFQTNFGLHSTGREKRPRLGQTKRAAALFGEGA